MRVPFFDLSLQYRELSHEMQQAMEEVMETGSFSGGPDVEAFEAEFARYCGTAHCVGMSSGTSALHMALLAAGVGPGDEVITTPMTFVATVAAIEYCGATPVLVDCADTTLTINPALIVEKITPRTKVILPVHLHGLLADMRPILNIARERGIFVIEDAAQAHGAEAEARKAGAFGTMGCFSFYPSKNLGAYGEAGAVVTDDPALAHQLRLLRNWGAEERDVHAVKGFNCRLHGLQAAVLRVKLPRLEKWNAARRALASLYADGLAGLDLTLPFNPGDGGHVYHVYAARTPRRRDLQAWLRARGIGTHIHYPTPVHLQPAYRRAEYPLGSLPVSERAANELLSLPMFPEMRPDHVARVCDEVRTFFSKG
ncbi:MAG: DegT/DnrJ/EryC1/StrS family aminotransferase [Rhodospirillaceae bacterium]|nr:DegT/DnrJ/EryC1/StrS family aminotransferase [Rhodospirillaceae bacterium]